MSVLTQIRPPSTPGFKNKVIFLSADVLFELFSKSRPTYADLYEAETNTNTVIHEKDEILKNKNNYFCEAHRISVGIPLATAIVGRQLVCIDLF